MMVAFIFWTVWTEIKIFFYIINNELFDAYFVQMQYLNI